MGYEIPWICPECGARQPPSEVQAVEIMEPGKDARVEYHGKVRPTYVTDDGESWIIYDCLVCGYSWDNIPEDPTPGGASITFLHPIHEHDDDCCDRDAC